MKTTITALTSFAAGIVLVCGIAACAPDAQPTAPTPNPASVTDPAETPYTPPVLHCESWQVPGWLNGHGDPTSCVNNEAVPGSHKGEPPATPAPAPSTPATECK